MGLGAGLYATLGEALTVLLVACMLACRVLAYGTKIGGYSEELLRRPAVVLHLPLLEDLVPGHVSRPLRAVVLDDNLEFGEAVVAPIDEDTFFSIGVDQEDVEDHLVTAFAARNLSDVPLRTERH